MHELDLLAFTLTRQSSIHTSIDAELTAYHTTRTAISSRIAALQSTLHSLRADLQAATQARKQREGYAQVTAAITALDSREECEAVLAALRGDIAGLEGEERALQAEEERRRRHFALLTLALDTVRHDWETGGTEGGQGNGSEGKQSATGRCDQGRGRREDDDERGLSPLLAVSIQRETRCISCSCAAANDCPCVLPASL